MNIITPNDEIPDQLGRSIFLIGPTPRDDKTRSWRIDAIKLLKNMDFEGTVLVPEIIGYKRLGPSLQGANRMGAKGIYKNQWSLQLGFLEVLKRECQRLQLMLNLECF